MAGYVFAIGGKHNPEEIIRKCADTGVYSTYLEKISYKSFEGTIADYFSMKPGDNIYFFCKRKYYGIGELISVSGDCKYCNYPHSSVLEERSYEEIKDSLLVDFGDKSPGHRWLCTFKGSPYFFEEGIDTDEILTYKPETFKMLRAFWKVSFIKLSDEENNSLKEIFLLRHQKELCTKKGILPEEHSLHDSISQHNLDEYVISSNDMLKAVISNNRIKHEMALEAAVIFDLMQGRIAPLGIWDYVSHQVIASPFKPIDYMDKIDVFAMRYLDNTKIPCKYLVVELKKDAAEKSTIDQIMKYVDWVCAEYAFGDYGMIEACIVAADYAEGINDYYDNVVQRLYTLGSHPVRNQYWNSLRLLKYVCDNNGIEYQDITPEVGFSLQIKN